MLGGHFSHDMANILNMSVIFGGGRMVGGGMQFCSSYSIEGVYGYMYA